MLDVRRLRLLRELADRGTIAEVARVVGYTPSAVSQHLGALERESGVALLERDGRRVRLTPAATALVERARRILDELEDAEVELHALQEEPAGPVAIGAFPSAAVALAAPALAALNQRHPDLVLTLHELEDDDGLPRLRAGELDLLIAKSYDLVPPPPAGGLERHHLLDDPVLVALPAAHPNAGRSVRLSDLQDDGWIAGTHSTTFGSVVAQAARAAGFAPRIAHRADAAALQLELVAGGHGVALLPRLAAPRRVTGVRLAKLTEPSLRRHVHALTRRGATRRPAVAAALAALQRTASER